MIKLKRVYEAPSRQDGTRVLVERLWPRGVKKEHAEIDWWPKEVAPSDELRKWYGHDPEKWPEFRKRYRDELGREEKKDVVEQLREKAEGASLTLVFATRDAERSSAVVLKEVLESR